MTAVSKEQAPETGRAVVVHEQQATSPIAIIDLIRHALEKGVPVEALERLQALHERVSDRNARIEFFQALAKFQELCPPITNSKKVNYVTEAGQRVNYSYAELPHIARTIGPLLKEVGLSYAWDAEVKDETLVVICTLRHANGHAEHSTFTVPTSSRAGMSPAQKFGAAGTYARRQSLVQVLGLTTCEPDTDGADLDPTPITADQAQDLTALLHEHGCDLARFLKWAKVEKLGELPAARFEAACQMVRAVGQRRAAQGARRASGGAS
jgi:hypothetical protein